MKNYFITEKIRFCLLLSLLIFSFSAASFAQKPQVRWMYLWNGLRNNQPDEEMPKGNASFQILERKAKINKTTQLIPVNQREWILSDGWELSASERLIESGESLFDPELNTQNWLNAIVPGTVLTTLVDQGIYPDPYFGLNNLSIPDTLCRMDWWYRIVFETPELSDNKQYRLLFNGINYRAEVFLNETKLGNIDGAFIRGKFEVTDLIKKSEKNVLVVHIFPPNNPGIPHEQSMKAGQGLNGGQLCLDGPTFICSEGWDWMPGIRDRNIGIWQDVRLTASDKVVLSDPQIITELSSDYKQAKITIHADIQNTSSQSVSGNLVFNMDEHVEIKQPYQLSPNESRTVTLSPENHSGLIVENPRLWWPNGYGEQHLYHAELKVFTGKNELSDSRKIRWGIREMSYELMAHVSDKNQRFAYSPVRTIKNGKPIFDYINRKYYDEEIQIPTLYPDADVSGLEELSNDDPIGAYLVIRVNGVRIFCRGGNWGMDD
ncbi:MAG: glycoside hydrolase family 2, partial [Dysgonamonadaceae bacterium]|nr:glycoside hydrolase family 2 [Dysgonamonadaceae bacterium]